MLYTSPSGALQALMIWVGVLGCYLFPRNRCAIILGLTIPPFAGNILLFRLPASSRGNWGLIVASWFASCISTIMAVLLSLLASNVKGNTKRAVTNTMFFIGYCVGNIGAPQAWTQPPLYRTGVILGLVTWCVLICTTSAYWWLCRRENTRRDQLGFQQGYEKGHDVTDKEDLSFRYNC